jgi:hypothetical protein
VKTKIELDVKLWAPPNFVIIKNPDKDGQDLSVPISLVDEHTLERLCDEYIAELFKKAGKSRPAQAVPRCSKCREML